MGYTHYYHTYDKKRIRVTKADRERVMPILRDIASRFEEILTGDCMGETKIPVILSNRQVCLNGIGENRCETFWFPLNSLPHEFTYCKTRRLPYDTPVSEMLIVLKHHFHDTLFVDSDGFSCVDVKPENQYLDDEWIVAASNVKKHYGIETALFEWEEKPEVIPEPVPIPSFTPILIPGTTGRRKLIRPEGGKMIVPNNNATNNSEPGFLPGLF